MVRVQNGYEAPTVGICQGLEVYTPKVSCRDLRLSAPKLRVGTWMRDTPGLVQ